MKSTIMEYGLYLVAAITLTTFLAGILGLFNDGGSIKKMIVDFANSVC